MQPSAPATVSQLPRWRDGGARSGLWEEGFWNAHHHEASKPAPTQQQTLHV